MPYVIKTKIDAIKCAQGLKKDGKIIEDIFLFFDEMYLQKREEYFGSELIASNENGELYRGIISFMIVGLKESIPYVIKSSPEITTYTAWLRDEVFECLDVLYRCELNFLTDFKCL